jgi:hypothetical protein
MGPAIPTMASEVPSNYIPSALWNANVYNLGTFLLAPPDFVGYQGSAQSVPNSAWTPLAIDNTVVDTYGGHSNVTNNSRYVCQTGVPGYYTVCGVYVPAGNASGFRAIRMQVNGSPVLGASAYIPSNGSVDTGVVTPTRDVFLNVGDYVELAGFQSTGSALNTAIDPDMRCALWVRFSHS